MKIRLTDIPPTGLPVTENLPAAALNARLNEGDNHGIVFTEDLKVSLTVFGSARGAETRGTVTTRYTQPCSRCAEDKVREVVLETNYILQPRPPEYAGIETEEFADDVGITYYDGEHVDLEDLIQETVLLSLSIYWHPEEDSSGACSLCSRSFCAAKPKQSTTKQPKQSLADLLKKAGLS